MNKEVLARLAGFLFSDGNLYFNSKNRYYEISFSLGEQKDVNDVRQDLATLGFTEYHVTERTKTIRIGGRTFTIHGFRIKCASKRLFNLFAQLGVPVGNKTDKSYDVPQWILQGAPELQRAFLTGYLGGDGAKVTILLVKRKNKNPYNQIGINDIELYKKIELSAQGLIFAYQLKWLLEQFGVKVRRIFCRGRFLRKDGCYSTSIHIKIASTVESALAYCSIGFAYCNQKTKATLPVKKFLEEINSRRVAWRAKHMRALHLYKEGLSIKEVANRVGLSYAFVFHWLKYGQRPTVPQHHLKFDEWVKTYVANNC